MTLVRKTHIQTIWLQLEADESDCLPWPWRSRPLNGKAKALTVKAKAKA